MTTSTVPLTHYSPGGGCACKLPQRLLAEVLTSPPADGGVLRVGAGSRR